MTELSPQIVDDVLQACQSGAGEASEALSRALDQQLQVTVGQSSQVEMASLPPGFDGPGLAVVMKVGQTAALFLLPENTGLLPQWCREPDPTGESKLTTLAQELGMVLLPESAMPEDFKAAWVKTLAGALARGGVGDGASAVSLDLQGDGKAGTALLVWPAPKPDAVIGAGAAGAKPKPKPKAESKPKAGAKAEANPKPGSKPTSAKAAAVAAAAQKIASEQAARRSRPVSREDLPAYTRSLLRVKLPVVVTLAEKRQPLGRVIELGPGSIIQFDKSCEEMLDLDVGHQRIASGEAVKVGDKFGLRITSIRLPEERFAPVMPESAASASQ
jgi:flagellar motor switch/type III secretory pathway protein FliN